MQGAVLALLEEVVGGAPTTTGVERLPLDTSCKSGEEGCPRSLADDSTNKGDEGTRP
jgi:hypothetical protein